ncbi:3763_t:CDS:2 [Ambispora gerdemannii]|uniref:3763_t:CDS:1 n=1 Tax=Ambispora gerdemannii TaxID=144530 RepID=A0A9N9GJQ8_9GLOM|nr:3763_t:CDS:2 [Ambispora gerdemannii]
MPRVKQKFTKTRRESRNDNWKSSRQSSLNTQSTEYEEAWERLYRKVEKNQTLLEKDKMKNETPSQKFGANQRKVQITTYQEFKNANFWGQSVSIIYTGRSTIDELIERFENPTRSAENDESYQSSLEKDSRSNRSIQPIRNEETMSTESFKSVEKWISELPEVTDDYYNDSKNPEEI